MCRNIRTLFNFEPPATEDEIRASALQFVRKLSGFTNPSRVNAAAFSRAVDDVADVARRLLASLETVSPARDREIAARSQPHGSLGWSRPARAGVDRDCPRPGRPTLADFADAHTDGRDRDCDGRGREREHGRE